LSTDSLTSNYGVDKMKLLRDIGAVKRLIGSGRPRSATANEENVCLVNDLVLSQEDTLQTHRMVREISHKTGIQLRC